VKCKFYFDRKGRILEEEVKMSTRVLLASAIVLLVVLLTGPLGYRFELVPLQPSLVSLLIAIAGGLLVTLVGLVYVVIAIRGALPGNRNLIILAMVLGLVPSLFITPQIAKARSVPPIHDITTDTDNPPAFVAILPLRANAPNGVEYGGNEAWPAEKLGETTREAYPDLDPIIMPMSVADAVDRTVSVLTEMGLDIVDVDAEAGRVEATATTYWFGFKDDMVVRISSGDDDVVIDLRSMSRVGQSDIGANADRIRDFIARFESL
jgi:uncharacterized protein (DUF1499 family)